MAVAHRGAKVFRIVIIIIIISFFPVISSLLDSPLPDGRLPNGGSINGPSGRQNYWGSANWSNLPAGGSGTIAGLSKPPLGRDPKSRARSRDYLKQYVVLASHIFPPLNCISLIPLDASRK